MNLWQLLEIERMHYAFLVCGCPVWCGLWSSSFGVEVGVCEWDDGTRVGSCGDQGRGREDIGRWIPEVAQQDDLDNDVIYVVTNTPY